MQWGERDEVRFTESSASWTRSHRGLVCELDWAIGSESDIAEYCSLTWGVTFPMSEKVRVNGKKAHPLFVELKQTPDVDGKAGRVSWNFEKFLVSPDGEVKRFRPRTEPQDAAVVQAIEEWLPRP